jgi:uncharacterized RDD family membrane protein YckC
MPALGARDVTSPGLSLASPQPAPLDTTVEIETPEHVRFRYQVAGPARRAAAYLVDFVLRGVVLMVLSIIVSMVSIATWGSLAGFEMGALLVAFFVLEWGYYVFCEVLMNGSSPGKRALRLRTVQSDGLPITFLDSLLRNLVRAADILPFFYAIGLISMSLDSRFRRLGDFVAGTLVIYEPPTGLGRREAQQPPPSRTDYDLPDRIVLGREERQALALFARRRPRLSTERAEELAELIAPALARRFGVKYRSAADFLEALHTKESRQLSGQGRPA